jgi:hypothetical protein
MKKYYYDVYDLCFIILYLQQYIMLTDNLKIRLNHTLYSVIIILTAYLMGAFPEKFFLIHSLKTAIYLILRFYSFKQKKYHYYMCDYCYFVNLFSLYVSLIAPHNILLQKILFVSANGPLALSVIVFKNKVVLHSMDQNTSSFIHISAMMLSYTYRWCNIIPEITGDESWLSFSLYGTIFYSIWAVIYGYLMFDVLRERIVEKGNITMFDWAIESTPLRKLKNISNNEKVQQLIYMCIHGVLTCLSMLISPIFWYYQWAHFGYMTFIITMAFWNGSYHYAKQEELYITMKKNKENNKEDNKEKNAF